MSELVDRLVRNRDHVEMDDRPTVRTSDDIDDSSEERLDRIARDDERSLLDALRFGGLVEERPDEARAVDLLHICRQGDGDLGITITAVLTDIERCLLPLRPAAPSSPTRTSDIDAPGPTGPDHDQLHRIEQSDDRRHEYRLATANAASTVMIGHQLHARSDH